MNFLPKDLIVTGCSERLEKELSKHNENMFEIAPICFF
jgi:hypothetical protein